MVNAPLWHTVDWAAAFTYSNNWQRGSPVPVSHSELGIACVTGRTVPRYNHNLHKAAVGRNIVPPKQICCFVAAAAPTFEPNGRL